VIAARLVAGAAATWIGYALIPHLFTPLVTSRGCQEGRRVALTFDDGPDPAWTSRVLDVLARHDVRGSFFVVGERAARTPDVVRAIAGAGHEIGSHGWSHTSLWLCGPRRTDREVAQTHALLADVTGRAPRHFRPPWGMVNAALFPILARHGERCVLWSIQPEGLRPVSAPVQAERVIRRAHPGAIVDLHDAEGTPRAPERLVETLGPMIGGLRDAGYGFATVAELLAPHGSAGLT
jgi:peptidoglycan/xylan/chitin deacetylase (PgdA/CDA1 family)